MGTMMKPRSDDNVVTLRKRGDRSFTLDADVMNVLRLRMYEHDVADLCEHMGVSKSCVYAIRSGRTKWPRGKTLFALMDALRIEMRLYDNDNQRYL